MNVLNACQRMNQLIEDLLNLYRLSHAEMSLTRINLSEIIRTIEAELKREEPNRQVTVIVSDDLVTTGDRNLIKICIENLLRNAWKYSSKHQEARIEWGTLMKDQETVFFIRDNGAGFDNAYRSKLFLPFQRLHSNTEFTGNGIGLALVKRILERHGGRIWAEGAIEKGATFYFTIGKK